MNENYDRGMMKWAPYQSLVEQGKYLAEMLEKKSRIPKPSISSDRAEEINWILTHYQNELLRAEYWESGHLFKLEGTIRKINVDERRLYIGGKSIEFRNLIQLEQI